MDVVAVGGDYTQQTDGTLAVELGGTVRGNQYDALVVSGQADLSGTLDVTLIDGFGPELWNTFDILDWGTLAPGSAFDTINLPDLDPDLDWDISALYTTGELSVVPEPATLSLLVLGGMALLRRKRK